MTKYWWSQLGFMEDALINLRHYKDQHPESETLRKLYEEKKKDFDEFELLTQGFSTLGTTTRAVETFLKRVKANKESKYYGNKKFLNMLYEEGQYFEINPESRQKIDLELNNKS